MENKEFCHLHVHSQYSQLDGLGKSEDYAKQAKKLGFKYLAITDHGNIDGTINFQNACKKEGIKSILGCELYIVPDMEQKAKGEFRGHMTVFVKNKAGWYTLCRLLSKANLEGFYHKPRVDFKSLLAADLSGLIFATACSGSFLKLPKAELFLNKLVERTEVYFEIMPHDADHQRDIHNLVKDLRIDYPDIPLIATNDCFAENTLILTDRGYKNIQDIATGDMVLTHANRFNRVSYCNSRQLECDEKMWSLKTPLGSAITNVTGNHPYYCAKGDFSTRTIKDICWKKVDDLEANQDFLLVPKIKEGDIFKRQDAKNIDLLEYYQKPCNLKKSIFHKNDVEYIKTIRTDKKIMIPRFLPICDDFLSVVGMYIANGCEYKNLIQISIHKDKIKDLVCAKKYFESFNLHPNLNTINNCAILSFSSAVFAQLFNKLCGKYSHNKRLPLILNLNKRQMLKVIEKYTLCDGSYTGKDLMVGATTSKKLCFELSMILNACGFIGLPQLQKNSIKNKNWRDLYCLTISGMQAHDFGNLINLSFPKPKRTNKKWIETSKFFALKLIKKTIVDYDNLVYNIEIDNDNSYTADNYIVHNCHYIKRDQTKAQEVLLAIQSRAKWNDPNRWKFDITGLHMRTAREMIRAFRKQGDFTQDEVETALKNTLEIAKKCSGFHIPKQDIDLPKLELFDGHDEEFDFLKKLCRSELRRLGLDKKRGYLDRLSTEMKLIKKKNFARYFLIVYDLINWCREENIMIGPGRGSVGGSLIAYLMGITSVDPIKYGLLFFRFISEDRIDYPDIDIDFEDIKRPRIRKYLEEKYGKNNICGISTFQTMKARGVIRDIARVFEVPFLDVDAFAKSMPAEDANLKDALKTDEGKKFNKKYPEIIEIALILEGQIRSSGQHAAAIVISSENLTKTDKTNICMRKGKPVSNWDMDGSEYAGLMKLDVLGLNTLSVLNETQRLIKKNKKKGFFYHPESDDHFVATYKEMEMGLECQEVAFDFNKLPLDDKEVFRIISEGDTAGIFQISAYPTTELCRQMKPDCFEDIATALALVRPGPRDLADEYIKRRRGARWRKKHAIYEEVTKDTYGFAIYQEQVMQVISKVAGLSDTIADKIRKVVAKKRDKKLLEQYKKQFLAGCKKQKTLTPAQGEKFWEELQKWAGYGFNLAHSIEYAMIAYWTAYCKIHWAEEYICASLTYSDKKEEMVKQAKSIGLTVMTPKLDKSKATDWVVIDKTLYIPFIEVKGIGDSQAEKICQPGPQNMGFFSLGNPEIFKGKTGEILNELKVSDFDEIPENVNEYFSFDISGQQSPELDELDIREERFINRRVIRCRGCELRSECKKPIPPSLGTYNIMIIAESPGKRDDGKCENLIGPESKILWDELKQYEYKRDLFHITNVCKCYPRTTKTPKSVHVKECSVWLEEEIDNLKPQLIFAMGNMTLFALTGQKGGIQKLSGTTTWSNKYKSHICWCINPSAVQHSSRNKKYFQDGVENFADVLEKNDI